MDKSSPLRDVTGRYLTRALFVELTDKEMSEKYPPRCTLKEAHDLYLSVADPTEYRFAEKLLGSDYTIFWDQWRRLLATPDFMVFLNKWREELEIKLRSNAVLTLKESAKDPEKGVTAARWLAEKGWEPKRKVGRPSKEEMETEKKVVAALTSVIDSDAERINVAK